jgi:hypothetical protein
MCVVCLVFRDLIKMDWLSKSDPLVAVWVRNDESGEFELTGHTEFVKYVLCGSFCCCVCEGAGLLRG